MRGRISITFTLLLCTILGVLSSFTYAAQPTCTAVPSVSNCLNAISSTLSKAKSASLFCSSVLGCTATPTITLTGTVTSTATKVIVESYTWEELGQIIPTTSTYSYTETETKPSYTVTVRSTYYVERFEITTVKPGKRDVTVHPKNLAARATNSATLICPTGVQLQACSCIVTCPTTVTKDNRKVIREKTTETSYSFTTTTVDYTDVQYDLVPFTTTSYIITTTTDKIFPTHTTTIKCTPSIANPSFYLQATNAPSVNNKYIQAYPQPFSNNVRQSQKIPKFTRYKDVASVFYLDSKSRLLSPNYNGTLYAFADNFNDFQLFEWLERGEINANSYLLYATCTLQPPSGRFDGGYQELTCKTDGTWGLHIFQYCPLYMEFYDTGLVLGAEASPETPDCQNIVFLAVPVCK